MSNVIPISKPADEAFEAYCCAARKAQATLDREDAEEAGRAWRRWLDLWVTREQREYLGPVKSKAAPCK